MKRKILAVVLSIATICCMMPTMAFAGTTSLAEVTITANANWSSTGDKALLSSVAITDQTLVQSGSYVKVRVYEGGKAGSWYQEGGSQHKLANLTVNEPGTYTIDYYAANLKNPGSKGYRNGSSNDYLTTTVTVGEVAPTVNEDLVYNTEAQQLLSDGSSTYYWLDSVENQFDNIEDVVATDAGEYKIYYGDTFDENKYVIAEIAPFALNLNNISAADVTYNGEIQKPTIECKISDGKTVILKEGKDYELLVYGKDYYTFKGAKNPVAYKAEGNTDKLYIEGKGNYTVEKLKNEGKELQTKAKHKVMAINWNVRALAPVVAAPVYNGIDQALIDEEETQSYGKDYVYEYRLKGHNKWRTMAYATDVDTYTVEWRLVKELKHGEDIVVDSGVGRDVEATIIPLNVFEGDNAKYTQKSKKTLTFKANGEFVFFDHILVDGNVVDADNYIAETGSTVITLKDTYLDTLKVGKHTLTICYNGDAATVDAQFEVLAAIDTGDSNNAIPYALLLMISVLGFAGYGLKKKNH